MRVTNVFPASGTYSLRIGAGDFNGINPIFGFVEQTLTTVPGQIYNLTFSYGEYLCCTEDPTNQFDAFKVLVDGNQVYSDSNFFAVQHGLNLSQGFYQPVNLSFTAASISTTLEFDGFNVLNDVALDNIDVEALPEPGTLSLLGGALLAVSLLARRRTAN